MREMEFTLEDVGNAMHFANDVTEHRISWLREELEGLLSLVEVLRGAPLRQSASAGRLARVAATLRKVREELVAAGRELEAALWIRREFHDWGPLPAKLALESVNDGLRDARERVRAVQSKVDMLFVLCLVLGRVCKRVKRPPLLRAKRAVRAARVEMVRARAGVERVFSVECGGRKLAREPA